MAWKHNFLQAKEYLTDLLVQFSCCDLCGETVGTNNLLTHSLPQRLICQYCIDDLPYFNQALIQGNLLNWPAIYHGLPNIHFDRLFALSPYAAPFEHWLAQLKYSGRFELAQLLSSLLVAQWKADYKNSAPVDVVLPVPLHTKKWQRRGYNQAHLIAKNFAKQLDLPYQADCLSRVKHNESQMGKTGSERRKNLSNAFAFNNKLSKTIKHVLLVDDVVTTGTTASEISKLLKSSGIESVTVLAVCLTLPQSSQKQSLTQKHKNH